MTGEQGVDVDDRDESERGPLTEQDARTAVQLSYRAMADGHITFREFLDATSDIRGRVR
jgi:uncharacterized protein YbcV (DUF1398 family)